MLSPICVCVTVCKWRILDEPPMWSVGPPAAAAGSRLRCHCTLEQHAGPCEVCACVWGGGGGVARCLGHPPILLLSSCNYKQWYTVTAGEADVSSNVRFQSACTVSTLRGNWGGCSLHNFMQNMFSFLFFIAAALVL